MIVYPIPILSPKQYEVLVHMADGLTTKDMSKRLHVSTHTVKNTKYSLYKRMGVHNGEQAIAMAFRKGWVK